MAEFEEPRMLSIAELVQVAQHTVGRPRVLEVIVAGRLR
jgi:hypothetical protein